MSWAAFALLLLLVGTYGACTNSPEPSAWELVWSDEFDYTGLPDSATWGYATGGHGWGNQELQHYTAARAENAFARDGHLLITARQESFGERAFTSARIITRGRKDIHYGRIEVRARVPSARGTWPAIWLMPADWTFAQGGWPDVGEIDIMEHVGHDPGMIHSSAHSKRYQWQAGTQKTAAVQVPDAAEEFHTYILEWSPDVIRTFVDDTPILTYENEGTGPAAWPYDKPFYLILNVAVGGAWGGVVDTTAFPQVMVVDFVRVYRRSD